MNWTVGWHELDIQLSKRRYMNQVLVTALILIIKQILILTEYSLLQSKYVTWSNIWNRAFITWDSNTMWVALPIVCEENIPSEEKG